jgi:hypothetical protein
MTFIDSNLKQLDTMQLTWPNIDDVICVILRPGILGEPCVD